MNIAKQAKQIYWRSFWITIVPLEIVLYACAFWFHKSLPSVVWQGVLAFLHPIILFLSFWTARNVLRRAGFSQERQTTETLLKSPEFQVEYFPDVQLRMGKAQNVFFAGLCFILGLLFIFMGFTVKVTVPPDTQGYFFMISVFCFLICLWQIWVARCGGYRSGFISAKGVRGYGASSLVTWSKIASCVITQAQDAKGDEYGPVFTFKGPKGLTIATVLLNEVPPDEQGNFNALVRSIFQTQEISND